MKNKPVKLSPPVAPATQAELDEFLRDIKKFRDEHGTDEDGLENYLKDRTVGTLESMARRLLMNTLGSPATDEAEGDSEPPSRQRPRKGDE